MMNRALGAASLGVVLIPALSFNVLASPVLERSWHNIRAESSVLLREEGIVVLVPGEDGATLEALTYGGERKWSTELDGGPYAMDADRRGDTVLLQKGTGREFYASHQVVVGGEITFGLGESKDWLRLSPDGHYLYSSRAGGSGFGALYDRSGYRLEKPGLGESGPHVGSANFVGSNHLLLTGNDDAGRHAVGLVALPNHVLWVTRNVPKINLYSAREHEVAAAHGRLIIGCGHWKQTSILCFDFDTGELLWSDCSHDIPPNGVATTADGSALVVFPWGVLALDRDSGRELARLAFNGWLVTSVYSRTVGGDQSIGFGCLVATEAHTGQRRELTAERRVQLVVTMTDGQLVVQRVQAVSRCVTPSGSEYRAAADRSGFRVEKVK